MKSRLEKALQELRVLLTGSHAADLAEAHVTQQLSQRIVLRDGQLEVPSSFEGTRIVLRLQKADRLAIVAASSVDAPSLKSLIQRALERLESSPPRPLATEREWCDAKGQGPASWDPTYLEIPFDEKIRKVQNLDQNFRKLGGIAQVNEAGYEERLAHVAVWSSAFSNVLTRSSSIARVFASVRAQRESALSPKVSQFRAETNYFDLDWTGLVKGLGQESSRLVGAQPVSSGTYRAVFTGWALAKALRGLSPVFKGNTALTSGTKITPFPLHIVDDPHLSKRPGSKSFDDEGTPTERLSIVKEGVYLNAVHNLETAAEKGVASSGHGLLDFQEARIRPAFHGCFIEPGARDFVDLIRELQTGLLVTRVRMLPDRDIPGRAFAEISGLRFENGVEKTAFSDVFIECDVRRFFQPIEQIARDVVWVDEFGAPSALFSSIRVMDLA